jgi:hypothetical protein
MDATALHLQRLHGEEYSLAHLFRPAEYGWPGDWEGRALLAFLCHLEMSGKTVPHLREFFDAIPEHTNEFGYFGAPFLVQSSNIASTDGTGEVFLNDGALFFNIRAFNVGEDYFSSSLYVFRVDVSADTSAFIELKCVDSNLPLSKEELPWEECLLPADPAPFTPSFTVGSAADLTPVSITDPDFVAVFNANDGFYHVGTADGPVILVKLSVDSEFLASFKTIMETNQFRSYVYDEDGNLIAKRNFHGMMEKYVTAAGDLGVYPLTSYLKEALTTIGNAWGWYDAGATNIFTGKLTAPVVRENAYLFACCYYDENQ